MSTKITLRLNAVLEVQTIDTLYGVLTAIFVFTSIVLFTKFKDFHLAPYSLVFGFAKWVPLNNENIVMCFISNKISYKEIHFFAFTGTHVFANVSLFRLF